MNTEIEVIQNRQKTKQTKKKSSSESQTDAKYMGWSTEKYGDSTGCVECLKL